MTEKRFKQVVDGVKDTRTGRTLTHPLEFTLKLNEINELYDCVFDRNEELEKENEQLKQYIYDNIDENICDVCSYQYLEKHSQMQGYYVAKCKKGYDNCSKGTVIHCKDFKFKELQE